MTLKLGYARVAQHDQKPVTRTYPTLDRMEELIQEGSSLERGSITVIENRILRGYNGMFLARDHYEMGPTAMQFEDVDYFHVSEVDRIQMWPPERYNKLRIERLTSGEGQISIVITEKGIDSGCSSEAIISAGSDMFLLAPSSIPYQTCVLRPDEYLVYSDWLRGGRYPKVFVEALYRLLADRVDIFSLDEDGNLVMPQDYANIGV